MVILIFYQQFFLRTQGYYIEVNTIDIIILTNLSTNVSGKVD